MKKKLENLLDWLEANYKKYDGDDFITYCDDVLKVVGGEASTELEQIMLEGVKGSTAYNNREKKQALLTSTIAEVIRFRNKVRNDNAKA